MKKYSSFFLFYLFLFTSAFAVDLETFEREVKSNQDKVIEFKYLREQAKLLGIKHVYLFGGTAASWGNYIRNYLANKETDRPFDFDYMSIYRATQDFDIVIDASLEQAQALESAMQAKFNYFSGTRPSWEVRLLNEQRADKEPILGFDFQNQHTDSHSTGLIDIMDCDDCIKDVRDMSNPKNAFLMDIYEGKLHYYFSPKHQLTSRFKKGKNPPILSVIRYFTKANQGKLLMRESDIAILQKIIHDFNPSEVSSWDPYVLNWLEKNAKKLIVNAIDMEFAWNMIDQMGLRSKLIALSNPKAENSMGWWLSKEPLRSKSLGTTGRTAKEIFGKDQIMVAHETNSFEAYESITKSHDLMANALISRKNTVGEHAYHSDGFYVRLGREGGAGTGLTIRFYLDPNAREGIDFTVHDDYIVINNKKALKVIPESLVMTPVEYFKKLAAGLEFDMTDRGVTEKLKRSITRQFSLLTLDEKNQIAQTVRKNFVSKVPRLNLAQEWFNLEMSEIYPEFVNLLMMNKNNDEMIDRFLVIKFLANDRWALQPDAPSFVSILLERGKASADIAELVFNKPHWNKDILSSWVKNYILKINKDSALAELGFFLREPVAVNHSDFFVWIDLYIAKTKTLDTSMNSFKSLCVSLVFSGTVNHPNFPLIYNKLLDAESNSTWGGPIIVNEILAKPGMMDHPHFFSFVDKYDSKGYFITTLGSHILSKGAVMEHPKYLQWIEHLIKHTSIRDGSVKYDGLFSFIRDILIKPDAMKNSYFVSWVNDCISKGIHLTLLSEHVFLKPEIIKHPHFSLWIDAYIEKSVAIKDIPALSYLHHYVLSKPEVIMHPSFASWLEKVLIQYSDKGSIDFFSKYLDDNLVIKEKLGFFSNKNGKSIIDILKKKKKTINCNHYFS